MREDFISGYPEYDGRNLFHGWEKQGLWKLVEWAIPDLKFYLEFDALVYVYKVC